MTDCRVSACPCRKNTLSTAFPPPHFPTVVRTVEDLRTVPIPSQGCTAMSVPPVSTVPSLLSVTNPLDDLKAKIGRIEDDDRKASDYIDRVVLTGGTAAILASVTFLSDIAKEPAQNSLLLLRISWGAFL